jgi:hypothetical protein
MASKKSSESDKGSKGKGTKKEAKAGKKTVKADGRSQGCSKCGEGGHNARSCKRQ